MGSVERARLVTCSARVGVHDKYRNRLASSKLYPPLTRTVARARGPPSITPTRLAAARHAPEGPRAAPSCDGCAASLAATGWGEHARDVLSTPTARLEVGSSVRAVVTRERRWLVAEWNGRTARTARASARRAGAAAGARHGRLAPPGKPSTIRCSPDLVPSVGPSGAAWGSR